MHKPSRRVILGSYPKIQEPLESQSYSAITLNALINTVSISHQSSPRYSLGEVSSSKEERTSCLNKATDILILWLAAEIKDELGNIERRLNNLERRTDSLANLFRPLLTYLARRLGSSWPVHKTLTLVKEEGAYLIEIRSEHITAERSSLFTSPKG
ncbi:hypothetical protein V8F44DRAFT_633060 [Aspergillus fumigatus]